MSKHMDKYMMKNHYNSNSKTENFPLNAYQ